MEVKHLILATNSLICATISTRLTRLMQAENQLYKSGSRQSGQAAT